MSNLEKVQKGMKVLQILSKIILIFAIVGVALASIGATLVASGLVCKGGKRDEETAKYGK